jgi:CubicO group peptidase (beta-lactamase class C family)
MALSPATAAKLGRRLREEQAERRLRAVVAAVVRDGSVVWSDAVGTLDGRPDGVAPTGTTAYRLGSITKTLVAVEVMRLRDEGALDLADTAADHLPELAALDLGRVTVAQLLTHTSGLQSETDGPWWERAPGGGWAALVEAAPQLRFAPGTRYHYSNTGYAVLGEIVARRRGVGWTETVETGVLRPLGLTMTTRPPDSAAPGLAVHPFADLVHIEPEHDAGAMAPAGQLWASVTDLAGWAAFLGGRTGNVLAADTLTEMLRPVALNDVPDVAWGSAHGLGWQVWNVDGRRYAGHGGSMPGFLATLRVDLETGDGVVLLTNATSGLGTVTPDLLDLLREHEPHVPTPWRVDTAHGPALDLVGEWFWGTQSFTLRLDGPDGLRLGTPGEGRGARFTRRGDAWVGLEGYYAGETLTVRRDADGTPLQLDLASFVFTRVPYDSAAELPGGHDPAGWH